MTPAQISDCWNRYGCDKSGHGYHHFYARIAGYIQSILEVEEFYFGPNDGDRLLLCSRG